MKLMWFLLVNFVSISAYAGSFAGVPVEFAEGYGEKHLRKFEKITKIAEDSDQLAEIGVVSLKFKDIQRETRGWLFGSESKYKMFPGIELVFNYDVLVDEELIEANTYRFGDQYIESEELYMQIQQGTENAMVKEGRFLANFTLDTLDSNFYQKMKNQFEDLKWNLFKGVLSKYRCVRTQIGVKHQETWEQMQPDQQNQFIDEVKQTYCSHYFSNGQ